MERRGRGRRKGREREMREGESRIGGEEKGRGGEGW